LVLVMKLTDVLKARSRVTAQPALRIERQHGLQSRCSAYRATKPGDAEHQHGDGIDQSSVGLRVSSTPLMRGRAARSIGPQHRRQKGCGRR
jgi:hypothetical protein